MHRSPARVAHYITIRNVAKTKSIGAPPSASLVVFTQTSLRRTCVTRHLTSKASDSQEGHPKSSTWPQSVDNVKILAESRHQDAEAWLAALDSFLPRGLQESATKLTNNEYLEKESADLGGVSRVLEAARASANVDLLSYLGVQKGRWSAVNWLVEAMLLSCHGHKQNSGLGLKSSSPLWTFNGQTLDEITSAAIVTDEPKASHLTIDALYAWKPSEASSQRRVGGQCLGHIWQALGSMMLGAEDMRWQNERYQFLMSQALNILAQMHHIDALPGTMYNYTTAKDDSVVQRPPTLYLLSSRIMTVLSDVAWKRHWASEMAKARDYGYQLPEPRVQPQLPQVGAEIWLEFVLWACVEGGWISEAGWIVSEMESRRSCQDGGWSVISWQDICEKKAPKLEWTDILKLQIDRARLNQSTGIGIASSGTSSVDMGPRTVSREVVSAIMDGVTNVAAMKDNENHLHLQKIRQHVADCMRLLERGSSGIEASNFNVLLLRMIDSASLSAQKDTSSLSQLIHVSPILKDAFSTIENSNAFYDELDLDLSASLLGLLHRILFAYADRGSYPGVTVTLEDIQNIIDANRNVYIQEFANELRERLKQGEEDSTSLASGKKKPPILQPQIPSHVISRILDFVAENQLTEMGSWLMQNNDIDGGIIQPNMYESANLQPALLRFATATSDNSLLNRVLEQLQPPLSSTTLHTLLHCQVAMNKWSAVLDILRHFQTSSDLNWDDTDVLAIGAAVLRFSTSKNHDKEPARQARKILLDVLQGRLDSPQDPAQRKDLSKIQEANQLKRILRSVRGSFFDFLAYDRAREAGRLSSRVYIRSSAFNILLEAVVERFGSSAGQGFWQRWCLETNSAMSRQVNVFRPIESAREAEEKVTSPKLYMLRTITRPLTQRLRNGGSIPNTQARAISVREVDLDKPRSSEETLMGGIKLSGEDLSLLKWAIPLFRSLQLDDEALNNEFPGVLRVLESTP